MLPDTYSEFEEGRVMLFDKPLYWTSFDLVNKVRIMIRSASGLKKIKVGHAGTLDPLATGLMIVCTGKTTRRIEEYSGLDKEYVATIHIGQTTPSYDLETETDKNFPVDHITRELLEKTLNGFIGEQEQMPPLFSAKFIDGKRAYNYARKGIVKEIKPVSVILREVELLNYDLPDIIVRLLCSKGTYIRSFARDLGEALGSGAYLAALVRTAIGSYNLEKALTLEKFQLSLEQMKQN